MRLFIRSGGRIPRGVAIAVAAGVALSGANVAAAQPWASVSDSPPTAAEGIDAAEGVTSESRDAVLGSGWKRSGDTVHVVVGGRDGLAVLGAAEVDGYAWSQLAALPTNDPEADLWISNSCVTSSGRYMVVVYGARTITNSEEGFGSGASAVVVDLSDGAIRDLGTGYSIAYHNPGCGAGDTVALSAKSPEIAGTLVAAIDAASGKVLNSGTVEGQATSAVSDRDGTIYAVASDGIIAMRPEAMPRLLTATNGIAYDVSIDTAGRLGFVSSDGSTASAYTMLPREKTKPTRIATGSVTELGIRSAEGGGFYLAGAGVRVTTSDASIHAVPVAAPDSAISSTGRLVVTAVKPAGIAPAKDGVSESELQAKIEAVATETGRELMFDLGAYEPVSTIGNADVNVRGPFGFARSARQPHMSALGDPHDPVESERWCSVPRNDPANQAYQPKPRQVEWAVDRAVKGELTDARPNNWRGLGMPSYTPQTLFPRVALSGGGTIPPQLVLGVLMQESNMWQASRYTAPGNTGNPLIGNFYGNSSTNIWGIDFSKADCGYGVGQITDGMRISGHDGGTALPYDQQRAIALDYTANIAMSVRMLGQKWNQLKALGITVNNGSASNIENWFAAVWAYNSGLQPSSPAYGNTTGCSPSPTCLSSDGTWGLGWHNNPINPEYPISRLGFLQDDNAIDAANPQRWPYPEKVMGFAAWGLTLVETQWTDSTTRTYPTRVVSSYTLSWWTTDGNRYTVKPPRGTFCKPSVNSCAEGSASPCSFTSLYCFWHGNATWKDCGNNECGFGNERFSSASYPHENDSMSSSALHPKTKESSFLPDCSTPPVAMLVVDDTSHVDARNGSSDASGDECIQQARTGSFQFTFGSADANGSYPAKVDLHQQGGGFNGHFYFAHTQDPTYLSRKVTGTWSLGQSLTNQWTRVWIHLPDYAAWTDSAAYTITYAPGQSQTRYLPQRRYANEWVPIGVFQINGVPTVSLSNLGSYNVGFDDVAWDAVGFQPLPGKPTDFVVALGDSFSSGEGAGAYLPWSDHDGASVASGEAKRNSCHQSANSWIGKTTLPGSSSTIAARSNPTSPNGSLDFHFLACSGATVKNLLPKQTALTADGANNLDGRGDAGATQAGMPTQLDAGYLDDNTTLVTLSIGGNDMRFADIVATCVVAPTSCDWIPLSGDTQGAYAASLTRLQHPDGEIDQSLDHLLYLIKQRAKNAVIVLMGYPKLFDYGTFCVNINPSNQPWLNDVAEELTEAMGDAAARASTSTQTVVFADPQPFFSGHNLCEASTAILPLWPFMTPGDLPRGIFGDDVAPLSQQSVHPSSYGTTLYSETLEDALNGVYP